MVMNIFIICIPFAYGKTQFQSTYNKNITCNAHKTSLLAQITAEIQQPGIFFLGRSLLTAGKTHLQPHSQPKKSQLQLSC
jgi:hypothetical protein